MTAAACVAYAVACSGDSRTDLQTNSQAPPPRYEPVMGDHRYTRSGMVEKIGELVSVSGYEGPAL